jgi:hypothetical protein
VTKRSHLVNAIAPTNLIVLTQHSVHSERSTALRQAQEPRLRPERSTERLRPELVEGSRRSLVELHLALSNKARYDAKVNSHTPIYSKKRAKDVPR